MTYEQALEEIHSLLTFGSRPGLDRMRRLLSELGDPQDRLRYIHVAGTNGKGSVCAFLSATLTAAGYKTGLFISPYITDFRERIQINNEPVSKETLTSAVEKTLPTLKKLRGQGVIITEFEYVNALQFYIHAEAECDVVVLETGMGGLLDCTNVIKPPLCSVITKIGLDHTAVLGGTIAEIAAQKCGIIKENSMVVTSDQPDEAMAVIEETARKKGVALLKSDDTQIEITSENLSGSEFIWNGIALKTKLAGFHQLKNAKTALTTLDALRRSGKTEVSDSDIQKGFASAENPARFELLSEDPIVLLDGAHNPLGMRALRTAINKHLVGKKIYCVIGMMADKDIESAIWVLSGAFEEICTVPVDNPRAIAPEELAQKLDDRIICRTIVSHDPREAFDKAYEKAKAANGAVLVCGSLYLAGEIRPYIIEKLKKQHKDR